MSKWVVSITDEKMIQVDPTKLLTPAEARSMAAQLKAAALVAEAPPSADAQMVSPEVQAAVRKLFKAAFGPWEPPRHDQS